MKQRPNLNDLAKEAYEDAKEKGFHDVGLSDEHCLMLVITELSEAVEADRKEKRANVRLFNAFDKDQRKHQARWDRPSHDVFSFESCVKDTIDDELADTVIRLLDLAGLRKYDVNRILLHGASVDCNKTFPENIFKIIAEIAYYKWSMPERINFAIINIEELCRFLSIDLWLHVEIKMKYNKTRPIKHGKKY